MTTLHVQLPDELREKVERRAAESGYRSVVEYVQALVKEDAEAENAGAPEHLRVRSTDDVERKLREALASPASEMTSADWAELRRKVSDASR